MGKLRLPTLQEIAGGAIGCGILLLVLFVFTYLLYVGYSYIQTH
jgi:hypothetical protein